MNQQHHPAEQQQTSNTNPSTSSGIANNLANNIKKNSMSLINELAQYNEIQYQYLPSGEKGPAHKKLYTVKLMLGNEEYEAEGTSIKKAQHSAAATALQQTVFKCPPPKTNRNNRSGKVTPTVVLNALAMKRRESTVYVHKNVDPAPQAHYNIMNQQHHPAEQQQTSNTNPSTSSGISNNLANNIKKNSMSLINELAQYNEIQYQYLPSGEKGPAHKKLYTVKLMLGNEEYEAEGTSIKKAQHSAAATALQQTVFKCPPPKTNRNNRSGQVTPTVVLNALAMKRRESTVYVHKNVDPAPQAHYNIMNQQHHPAEQQQTSNTNPSTSSGISNNLANNIKKNSMSLINELAQYNEIQYQYLPSGEKGPAHKKLYTVKLMLGNEEYEAEGTSIKKAQHSAAATALQQTVFKCPPPKTNRNNRSGQVTPTVVLNALAMKRRESTVYVHKNVDPAPQAHGYMSQSGPSQSCYQDPPGKPFSVRLRVGEREYPGMGYTKQAARHDAASKAVEDITRKEMNDNEQCPFVNENALPLTDICNELNIELKPPISLVYEIASKRNLKVTFQVLSEKGPSHMKVFTTLCRVGDLMAEGQGNAKKISKGRAAEKMFEELRKLGPLPNTTKKSKSDYTSEINPIVRLHQIQLGNKEKAPVYDVIEEEGKFRYHKFVIRASVNGQYSTGVGSNKKIAKRNAAAALLAVLGYTNSPATRNTPKQVEKKIEQIEKPPKVIFMKENQESAAGSSGGRQLIPGLLLAEDQSGAFRQPKVILGRFEMLNSGSGSAPSEMKNTGQVQTTRKSSQDMQNVRTKDQLDTSQVKADLEAALEAVNIVLELDLNNVTTNKESNAESAHGGSTATPQVVPKAKLN